MKLTKVTDIFILNIKFSVLYAKDLISMILTKHFK